MRGGWSRAQLRQWWWIAFVLGGMMINYPFLHIFNRSTTLAGFPLLFLYLFVGWGASIGVIGLYVWVLAHAPEEREE